MRSVAQRIYYDERAHRVLPWPIARRLVARRAGWVWDHDAQVREQARAHMRFLLGKSDRAAEIEELSRRYVVQTLLRLERWFRPWQTTKAPPSNVALLHELAQTKRGVVVNFMHHADFHGALGALGGQVALHVAAHPFFFDESAGATERQIVRTLEVHGATMFPARGSSDRIRSLLNDGQVVAAAIDVPGSAEVTWLGRRVRAASGMARLAFETGSWVVPMTQHPVDDGQHVTLDAPVDPTDFESPEELTAETFRRHEPAVLAWPEAVERPLRGVQPVGADLAEFGWAQTATLKI